MGKKKRKNRMILSLLAGLLLFCSISLAAAETELPEGAVAGLPERLAVTDSEGNSVNSGTGEYFFCVENMTPGEVYTKNLQVMNLREDKAYHIYFYAAPVGQEGEINLEEECTAVFSLNGQKLYEGKVTGEGTPDMRSEPLDLGYYEPGQSAVLQCSVVWNGGSAEGEIDYGQKLVGSDGTEVLKESSGDGQLSGEVTFRWIFYAVVDEEYVPPKTGIWTDYNRFYAGMLITVGSLILLLLFLIYKKRRKAERK